MLAGLLDGVCDGADGGLGVCPRAVAETTQKRNTRCFIEEELCRVNFEMAVRT